MVELGKINSLKVIKVMRSGIILDGGTLGEILIPEKEAPANCRADDNIEVFIYIDSKAQMVSTTKKPYAVAGQFALLKVALSNSYGAFLDWGLKQNLRVPVREQKKHMQQGESYVVFIYNDKKNHIAASSRLDKFLEKLPVNFTEGQPVDLVIGETTPLGYKAIINNIHVGVLYTNEVFQILEQGQEVKGFIKKIREDGKIDLSLQKHNAKGTDDLSNKILNTMKEHGGSLKISDKSLPEEIYRLFGVSKKRYKNAIGALYKKRMITVDEHSISLIRKLEEKPLKNLKQDSGRNIRRKNIDK
ncbi:MAG: GntR family transcriptional regulator [Desulfobacterium sp.]|nr:GntR family transcriptional regulator [Desulfobacterium sp.]MBU3948215.1 GntR family transcriptional regulator [Pseudomonadota bacterium]MBU4035114.1 GntR family transcriptional regulator [Pseudomonadota bacterium]